MEGKKEVRVLVVDEGSAYFELICEHAEMNDHYFSINCAHVENGEEVLEKIRTFAPTIILLDAHIPDVNCFEILERCKEGLAPIIVTSDNCSPEIEVSARMNGASGYVTKSTNPEHLDALIFQIATLSPESESTH